MPQSKEQAEKPKKRAPRKRASKPVKTSEVASSVSIHKVLPPEATPLSRQPEPVEPSPTATVPPVETNKPRTRNRRFIHGFLIFLVILFAAALWYQFVYSSPESTARRADKEAERTIAEVGTLILLPTSEIPVIYDIDDPVLLMRQQPFFTGAEKGDKLLIYSTQGKAIIYSPRRHIIVNVGGIVTDTAETAGLEATTNISTTSDDGS
ncbi:hypothetical protein GW943_00015 [Candidatus Parcubacteria bacterium]|uniref:Uncharacterized protein n=1 Tax=Candidatus Kaiserbacteria bacterium CG10_big_fil_rev_8_21_14_0_10_47_16 TaxID=1974608 RepID=A0A2H0UEP9_9BACT|nr:hypothetical protein [Candidatus Parcubacteria bacterium]PIR84882.1 MAG: hypothetical protein COU16_00265 [Candidatus Kaiserbacteria bacterium CG10_big_fil_rev_8_21_14_0_10_47_16]